MPLLPRELEVLRIIVEDFIQNAEPVGSRTVAKLSAQHLSPASMRNTMADLTDQGFLIQPHTSAGRVPTLKAFRFYLDTALRPHPLAESHRQRIMGQLASVKLGLPDLLQEASNILSSMSHQVSMVIAPSRNDVRWREIDFNLVNSRLVLVILILEGGMVLNKLVEVQENVTSDDLIKFANYLNAHFAGRPLFEARTAILGELQSAEQRLEHLYQQALLLARQTFENLEDREIYVDGALNILDHVEFAANSRMREVLAFLEERSKLLELLDRTIAGSGLQITLCQEAQLDDLRECSVVSSTYGDQGRCMGAVGVIGPVRMDYAAVVPMVDCIAKTLSNLLKSRFDAPTD